MNLLLIAASALILSVFGALLGAIEAAYSVTSRADLEQYEDQLGRKAKVLHSISDEVDPHLSAVAFVKIFAESFAAVLLTFASLKAFTSNWMALIAVAIFMLVLSFFAVGVGPKSYGRRYPLTVIKLTVGLVRALRVALGPVADALCKLARRPLEGTQELDEKIKNEQLLSMVDRAAEQDLLEEEEQDIIHSVVEFGDTLVREVMVPRTDMVTADASSSISEAFEEMLRTRHSRVPVISGDSDDIVGVAYLRDLAGYIYRRSEESANQSITRIMKPPQFVPELVRADDLLRKMQRDANHLALVVDEYGGIAGLVTLEDLIEELIGDINDEHDRESEEVIETQPGVFLVSSKLEIDKFGELFGLDLEDEEALTVSGLISKKLGRLAEENETVVVSGIELTVVEYDRKKRMLKTLTARWVGEDETQTNVKDRDENGSD